MSNPAVSIPMDVLAWWYCKAKMFLEKCDPSLSEYPVLAEMYKQERKQSYEIALKTVEALKGVFEKDIICEMEDTNHE